MKNNTTNKWNELTRLIMARTEGDTLKWQKKERFGTNSNDTFTKMFGSALGSDSEVFIAKVGNTTVEFGKRIKSSDAKNFLYYFFRLKDQNDFAIDFFEHTNTNIELQEFKNLFLKIERQVSGADNTLDNLINDLKNLE